MLLVFSAFPVLLLVVTGLGLGPTGRGEHAGFTLNFLLEVFIDPRLRQELINSLVVGLGSVIIMMILGIPLTLALSRQFPGEQSTGRLNVIFTMPIALPGIVVGFFTILLLGRTGIFGQVIPGLQGAAYTLPGIFFAYIYFSFPRVIGPLQAAMSQFDHSLVDTARTLGASRTRAFFTVSLPIVLPAVIDVLGTAAAVTIGGYGTIATLSRGDRLLPLSVVDKLSNNYQVASAAATAVVLAALAASVLLLSRWISRQMLRGAL